MVYGKQIVHTCVLFSPAGTGISRHVSILRRLLGRRPDFPTSGQHLERRILQTQLGLLDFERPQQLSFARFCRRNDDALGLARPAPSVWQRVVRHSRDSNDDGSSLGERSRRRSSGSSSSSPVPARRTTAARHGNCQSNSIRSATVIYVELNLFVNYTTVQYNKVVKKLICIW